MSSKESSKDKEKDKSKIHKLSLKGSAKLVAEFVSSSSLMYDLFADVECCYTVQLLNTHHTV